MFLFGTASRANRGYSRTRSSPPLPLCLDVSLSALCFLPLRSNIELILCLFLGAKARGACVCVCARACAS